MNHQFETTVRVVHIDLSEGWLETTLDGDMYLPTGSSLTDCNRWWQTEVTITVGTYGVQSTQITPIKSTLLTEVHRATRQPARQRPGARKLSNRTVSVQSTGPVVGQRWQIDLSVPLHFENRLGACRKACYEATIHDRESFELLLGRVMSLLDCATGARTEARGTPAQPAVQTEVEWPRRDPTADAALPVHPAAGQGRLQQEQSRWTLGDFVGGILPSGQSHPQSRPPPDPLSWRRQAIAAHTAMVREPKLVTLDQSRERQVQTQTAAQRRKAPSLTTMTRTLKGNSFAALAERVEEPHARDEQHVRQSCITRPPLPLTAPRESERRPIYREACGTMLPDGGQVPAKRATPQNS